jgi:hypothetical protein
MIEVTGVKAESLAAEHEMTYGAQAITMGV